MYGKFLRLYAGILAEISADRVIHVEKIEVYYSESSTQTPKDIIKEVKELMGKIKGNYDYIVCEKGEFFKIPKEHVSSLLGKEVIHPKTLGELELVNIAHHVSYSCRKLLLRELELNNLESK
ncbi:Uncharacterized conserved protein UCP021940 [Methanotorris formicicus Mc-S-70]|uniref:Uncharacterized conserved protein UCP021940 n=1 Tax=Methanotorris formicicus Mc-S-70 TaxID=647171 RepID=H1KYG1_9EURY|nr:Uncharacterized conserved protein UCP021940 [Methanotorris formicicus Mc-S-70]